MAGAGDGLRRLAQRAERMEREWPRDAADVLERAVTGQLRSATGDGALSHGRDMGRATVVARGGAGKATVEAGGSMAVWAIIQSGTSGHTVRAGAGRVLRTPFGPRRQVTVSGAPGKRTWTHGVARGMPAVETSAERAFREMVRG